MTVNFQQELNHIIELKGRATRLDTLIQGYWLCAPTQWEKRKRLVVRRTALAQAPASPVSRRGTP